MTHWKEVDFRVASLKIIMNGLDMAIEELWKKTKTESWYDSGWFLDESEPIIGIGFIAFQTYINGSIYDRHEDLSKQFQMYRHGIETYENGRTAIELIVSIANYVKHRDHPEELHRYTKEVLVDFGLSADKDADVDHSPIFQGLDILSSENSLSEVMTTVIAWRQSLWS